MSLGGLGPVSSDQSLYVRCRHHPLSKKPDIQVRLTAQHLIWKEKFGLRLHPSINIEEGMTIVNVGAGTRYSLFLVLKGYRNGSFLDEHESN